MRYMTMLYFDETSLTDQQREQCYGESGEYAKELMARGKCVMATPLYPTSTATSLRFEQGRRVVTDGPFAETREQLGGFFLIEANDLDEAMEIASKIPARRWGTVEIRPVLEIPGLEENVSRGVESKRADSI